jgi:hypothetical protein
MERKLNLCHGKNRLKLNLKHISQPTEKLRWFGEVVDWSDIFKE